MPKTILITGSTDGIGLETAKMLAAQGHHLLIHGRNPDKLAKANKQLAQLSSVRTIDTYTADLSSLAEVDTLARSITETHRHLDVVINNAGVFNAPNAVTDAGLDVRFVVNTIAPYRLTQCLLPLLDVSGRVVNLSSAAQAPVDVEALLGKGRLPANAAYAQSKLALTMWSRTLARSLGIDGPVIVAVNPGSLLGSKMVKDAFGVDGSDLSIGAEILTRAALSDDFAEASGKYFDNDSGRFAPPHPDALDDAKCAAVLAAIETILSRD